MICYHIDLSNQASFWILNTTCSIFNGDLIPLLLKLTNTNQVYFQNWNKENIRDNLIKTFIGFNFDISFLHNRDCRIVSKLYYIPKRFIEVKNT